MKNKLHYAKEARLDLDDIWDYIVGELSNVAAAAKTVNRIMDMVYQLADFPQMGTPLSSVSNAKSDYRFLVSGNYLIFYRERGRDVYVDRVLYGRRDYLHTLLGKNHETEPVE